ncbi:hypothetical protein M8C13_05425 [Crossiella sp. SN42]|uniref:hypothetical protein n=1 Tax=Crossiella sp. SN42 TaxID=2944808 RepID=UPI00207CC95B|nr:hypothetical protein [Crossiella sp. SN42]MCO1575199.1 hypothetical protein [Crossiella sp. SN42]
MHRDNNPQALWSIQNTVDGVVTGPVVQAGSIDGGVRIVLNPAEDYVLEFRADSAGASRRLARDSPSYLLDARSAVVPYRARSREQERLRTWRNNSDELSVLLVYGPGGHGKTRLAAHFAKESFDLGWAVADASRGNRRSGGSLAHRVTDDRPVLVVVDYADRWGDARLAEMVEQLAAEHRGAPTRVLLLARSADQWWHTVASTLDLQAVVETPLQLGGFATTDLHTAYAEAIEAFQRELQLSRSTVPMPEDIEDSANSPLELHMAALAATCASREHLPRPTQRDLSQFLLHRERRYWADQAPLIEQVALIATMFGPFETAATARSMLRAARVTGNEAEADRALRAYQRLYPPAPREVLSPIRPDRLGEDFTASMMTLPLNAELIVELVAQLDQDRDANWPSLARCMAVLGAAGHRHEQVEAVVVEVCTRVPHSVLYDAGGAWSLHSHRESLAVVERQFTTVLGATTGASDSDRAAAYAEFLAVYAGQLPHGDVLDLVRRTLVWELVRIFRRLSDQDAASYLPMLATALSVLSQLKSQDNSLNSAERAVIEQPPGLEPAREAVRVYRRLARTDPGTYLWKLIDALGWLADLLAEAEQSDEEISLRLEQLDLARQHRPSGPTP